MAQWNHNTVTKCEDKTCSDEVLVTVEKGKLDFIVLKDCFYKNTTLC